jgi:hypothetical protein
MPTAASAVEPRHPVENRRLKMIGLALAVGGVVGLGSVADHQRNHLYLLKPFLLLLIRVEQISRVLD